MEEQDADNNNDNMNNKLNYFSTIQPTIILYAYLIPIIVFIGSFIFHSTLTYTGQLLDELPMIYGICYFNWILSAHNKKRFYHAICMKIYIIFYYIFSLDYCSHHYYFHDDYI